MRKIEYRGKRVDTGEWMYGHLFNEGCYCFIIGNDSDTEWNIDLGVYLINGNGMIEIDPATVGEYTGLTLSDGTDIYEGDVLRLYGEEPYDNGVVGMDYDWEFFGTVVFQDGSFVVQEFSDKCCIWIDAIFCEDIDVEKLGNIHDNPELVFGEEVEQ